MSAGFLLESFIDRTVSVITNDGHNYVGVLKGVDQTTNIIVSGCQERVYTPEGGKIVNWGHIFVLRGDNIAIIGEVDTEKDTVPSDLRGEILKPVLH